MKTDEAERVYYPPHQFRRLSITNAVFSFERPARRKKGAVSLCSALLCSALLCSALLCSALRSVFLFRMAVKPPFQYDQSVARRRTARTGEYIYIKYYHDFCMKARGVRIVTPCGGPDCHPLAGPAFARTKKETVSKRDSLLLLSPRGGWVNCCSSGQRGCCCLLRSARPRCRTRRRRWRLRCPRGRYRRCSAPRPG